MAKTEMTFRDKILPVQPVYRTYFTGDGESLLTALYESVVRFGGIDVSSLEFRIRRSAQVSVEEMSMSPIQLRLLELLILLKRPKRILEIGTFIGVSALHMARVLPEGGQVVTLEKYDHFAELARENFANNQLADRIQLIQGDALEELKKMESAPAFDMAFVDGNKERYLEYFRLLDPLLEVQGLLVVDDVFFHGDVLNVRPKSEKGAGVRKLMEHMRSVRNYHKTILPIGNGMMLALKLGPSHP